jgi:hypothetical protein
MRTITFITKSTLYMAGSRSTPEDRKRAPPVEGAATRYRWIDHRQTGYPDDGSLLKQGETAGNGDDVLILRIQSARKAIHDLTTGQAKPVIFRRC